MYAPSLYPVGTVVGDFATQAERDYLFDSRDFNTVYEQTLFSLVLDGDIFEMPGGEMAQLAIGFEHRIDDIQSNPDDVARDGLFWGFFSDKGAFGEVDISEVFAEVQLPLLLASASHLHELSRCTQRGRCVYSGTGTYARPRVPIPIHFKGLGRLWWPSR
jgi:hypothetical protein